MRRRIGTQLAQIVGNNLGIKLVSIGVAVVLWFIVLGSRNIEESKDIPIEVIAPVDLVAGNDLPERVTFRLAGPKAFLRAVLDRREDPIRVNLSGAKAGVVTYRFFSDNIRLPIGVKVISINPSAIVVKLEPVQRKEVPVRFEVRGVPPEGFRLIKAEAAPSTVKIKGAESRVAGIRELSAFPIDVSAQTGPLEKELTLDLARQGLTLDGPAPKAIVDVAPVSANYRIKNVDVRVNASLRYKLEEKNVTVLVRASSQDLVKLDRSRVYASIEVTGQPKGRHRVPVKVSLPDGVGLVKVIPDHVHVNLY